MINCLLQEPRAGVRPFPHCLIVVANLFAGWALGKVAGSARRPYYLSLPSPFLIGLEIHHALLD